MDNINYSFSQETKFLVTGGAGFIGSNLCEALVELGYYVRCLDNFSLGKKENIEHLLSRDNFEMFEGDIRDLETCMRACENIDYVSHQAAWGSVPKSIKMPLLYEAINVRGTLNMLEAAKENEVKKFVYASSSSVYGDEPNLPKREGKEGKILSPYALTKKVDEEYARLYHSLYELPTIGLRYFNVFGKKQDPNGAYAAVIPKFIKILLDNQVPTINGDGLQSRDFTYVENVIQANLRAMESDSKADGKAYNIAYGGQLTLNDLYDKLCELLNKESKPNYGPDRVGDIKHSNADISLARELLNYNPQYDFFRGIEVAVDWYKENL